MGQWSVVKRGPRQFEHPFPLAQERSWSIEQLEAGTIFV